MINLVIKSTGIVLSILGILFSLLLIFSLQGTSGEGAYDIFYILFVLATGISFPLILYGFIVNYESEISKLAALALIIFNLVNALIIIATDIRGDAELGLIVASPAIIYFIGYYFKNK